MNVDRRYMSLAIALARKAEGRTSPNPLVGAVVVKNNRIIATGYHKKAGLPHAEVNALRKAGARSNGASLYVTLEPCDHFGRTPPCTNAIIASGIKKVVIGMKDPNPINNGRGIKGLKRHGILTKVGVLGKEVARINKPYIKFIKTGLPYVTVKIAESLDGKIATKIGDSKWITQEDARAYVHRLRGKVDAIMVGANTVVKDNPLLTARAPGIPRQPVRIVIDSKSRLPLKSRIFSKLSGSPVIIATTSNSSRISTYEKMGVDVLTVKSKAGRVDLKTLMRALAKKGIVHILAEGGGELTSGLFKEGLVDRVLFFIAPKIIGGRTAVTSVEGDGAKRIRDALTLSNMNIVKFKNDILIEAEVFGCLRE